MNRRDFIKTTLAAVTLAALPTFFTANETKELFHIRSIV